MRRTGFLLVATLVAGPALGQPAGAPATSAPPPKTLAPTTLTCGALKADASRMSSTSRWTISGPSGNTTETGVLRGGPHFECVDGAILIVEVTSAAGYSLFTAYFPDGTDIGYGRQQIERRGTRYVLPIQSKARIAPAYRAAFDYHCRLDMPADPILPATRADCLF